MKKITLFFLLLPFSFTLVKAQSGIINTIAGDAGVGYNGDNRQATTAELDQDGGVAVDAAGNVYIADYNNNRIRKVATTGIITTVAGNGFNGFSGNGGQATAAEISFPECVRVDTLGNIYFSEAGNAIIRKVNAAGRISTIAGIPGIGGFSGNGGQATAAELNNPVGIAIDKNLNVYVADQVNNQIRKISTSGIITAVAGTGAAGFSGNGAQATNAKLDQPTGVAVDRAGNMYIADYMNNEVRKVSSTGIINQFAGTTVGNFNGFGGTADTTELFNPTGVAVSNVTGNVYIADAGNGVVREVMVSTNQMYVIAGIVDDAFSGDGGPAYLAEVNYPFDVMPDNNSNVYIADLGNNRIRKITAGCAGNTATIGVYNYPECYGGTDGIMEGFTNSNFEPYQYLWSPGGKTTMKDSGVVASTYTLTVTDALGCSATTSTAITQPTQVVVTTGTYTTCAGSQVTMSSSASGGVGAYTYTWITGAPTDTTTVLAVDSTTYTIYVNDGNGCYDSATAYVDVNPLPLVILNAQTYRVCTTDTSDTLAGSPAGGTYSGPDLTGNIFNPSAAGAGTWNFTYSYTDPNTGCSATGVQSIIVSTCTGIEALKGDSRIAVYPNPASNQFTVELQSGDAAQIITMYNVTGQQVYEHKYTSADNSQLTTINTQEFSNGVYFLKVVLQDGSTLVQKVDIVK